MIHFRKWLLVILVLSIVPNCFSQSINAEVELDYLMFPRYKSKRHSINLELLGSAGLGSINYEREITAKTNHRWMYRVGIGGSYIDKNNGAILIFPLMTHFLYGKKKHYLDLSAGLAPSITTHFNWFVRAPLGVGYRFEHWNKRLYYRVSYTPLVSFILDFQYEHWGGVTIGYHFNRR